MAYALQCLRSADVASTHTITFFGKCMVLHHILTCWPVSSHAFLPTKNSNKLISMLTITNKNPRKKKIRRSHVTMFPNDDDCSNEDERKSSHRSGSYRLFPSLISTLSAETICATLTTSLFYGILYRNLLFCNMFYLGFVIRFKNLQFRMRCLDFGVGFKLLHFKLRCCRYS